MWSYVIFFAYNIFQHLAKAVCYNKQPASTMIKNVNSVSKRLNMSELVISYEYLKNIGSLLNYFFNFKRTLNKNNYVERSPHRYIFQFSWIYVTQSKYIYQFCVYPFNLSDAVSFDFMAIFSVEEIFINFHLVCSLTQPSYWHRISMINYKYVIKNKAYLK